MEQDLWIEQGRSLQVTVPETIILHSLSNMTKSAQVQDIVQEVLGLHVGQVGVWSRRDDEGNEFD